MTKKGAISGEINVKEGTIGIADSTFNAANNVSKVNIPSSVIYMCENVFQNCNNANLIINIALTSQPDTWHINWNPKNRTVTWLPTGE